MSTVIIGLLVLTTRVKAVTQVVGYLMLENGIYTFGLTLAERVPLLVELGVLLDVFVGVFIMGIVVFHINREFDSLNSAHLTRAEGLMRLVVLILVPLARRAGRLGPVERATAGELAAGRRRNPPRHGGRALAPAGRPRRSAAGSRSMRSASSSSAW